jgi:hypothetical protein
MTDIQSSSESSVPSPVLQGEAHSSSEMEGRQDSQPQAAKPSRPDYRVGYGRPPVASRFKKGQSGNPKGRPKVQKDPVTLLREALHKSVKVREGDRVFTRPALAVALDALLNQAARGNTRALLQLIPLLHRFGLLDVPEPTIEKIVLEIVDPKATSELDA